MRKAPLMSRGKKTICYSIGGIVVAVLIWFSFRIWENGNDDSPPVPYLSYVRAPTDQTDKLIVFVHGFGSDAKAAWTSDRTGKYWPQMIADDKELLSFAVLTASYNSPPLHHAATIEEAAVQLGTALKGAGIYTRYTQV